MKKVFGKAVKLVPFFVVVLFFQNCSPQEKSGARASYEGLYEFTAQP